MNESDWERKITQQWDINAVWHTHKTMSAQHIFFPRLVLFFRCRFYFWWTEKSRLIKQRAGTETWRKKNWLAEHLPCELDGLMMAKWNENVSQINNYQTHRVRFVLDENCKRETHQTQREREREIKGRWIEWTKWTDFKTINLFQVCFFFLDCVSTTFYSWSGVPSLSLEKTSICFGWYWWWCRCSNTCTPAIKSNHDDFYHLQMTFDQYPNYHNKYMCVYYLIAIG